MAKKVLAAVMVFTLVFSMTACGSKTAKPYDYDLSEYVTIGDYMGIEVERVDAEPVTDEMVDTQIQSVLQENATTEQVTEGTVEQGDTVNIDYAGTIDGEAFDGGTAEGQTLTIGSGQMIDGFEDGLVGKKVGETVVLNLTFPEDYATEDLAGKAAEFTVTINSLSVQSVPELNDKFVAKVSDCKTVDEYKVQVREDLEKEAQEVADQTMKSAAWASLFETCEVIKYPETEIEKYKTEMQDYYTQYAESYGMDFASFLEMAGMTEDSFADECQSYAENTVKEEMVMYSIARQEDLTISDDEYKEGAQDYVESMGFDDVAALEEAYGEDTIRSSLLWSKFFDFLLDNAKIVDQKTVDADADTDAAADSTDAADSTEAEKAEKAE